ncbi:MAG: glycoside hydrolase family 31 [Chloroflexi bacterium]|nr:glycoside hydrolase family 31 [Chloroflexota bacterium]
MTLAIHTPFGQEHPYEQVPEERFPRQPLAGQPFTVGIVTRPPGQVQRVRVLTSVDGVDGPPVEAAALPSWQQEAEHGVGAEFLERIVRVEQDVWRAQLNAPAHGSALTYTVEADGIPQGSYRLSGEAWETGGGTVYEADGRMMVRRGNAHPPVATVSGGNGLLPAIRSIEWLTEAPGGKARRVRVTFAAQPDEAFFGLGERYNALDQRGEVLDVRLYEQYKSQGKRTYMPIPFLLSSAGWGAWVESSRWMQFDLCAGAPDVWTLEADLGEAESLTLHWFADADPLAIIRAFSARTGKTVLPPLWSFGLWMSGNEWNSQARVEAEVQASFEHRITPSVMVIEAWSDENTFYIWNDAQYTPKPGDQAFTYSDFTFPPDGKWTDPKAMIDRLHAQNIRLILWQIPAVKRLEEPHAQHEADRATFEAKGYGIKDPDGSLHTIRPFWFRHGWIWDVTNPAARDWWFNKRAYLVDELGVDGFKTDGGEHLWSTQVSFADGRSGAEVWNEYPKLYTQAYYDFVTAHRGGDGLTFSRAGFTGSQSCPSHWAGDENSTWEAFRHTILGGLSAAASGISFWGWDIGGFSGDLPSSELFLRGTAMAAFCPIFQYHSEYNAHRLPIKDRTPWHIQEASGDERVIPTFRFFTDVRHNLMPYIWQEAQHSAAAGEPMMRALRWTDPRAGDMQYFFGRSLLVCPITEPGVTQASVYLPEGVWHDLWTGKAYTGGGTVTIDAPLDRIPVFVPAGARIPVRWGANGLLGEPVPLSGEANGELAFA